jgi:amino acid transporter
VPDAPDDLPNGLVFPGLQDDTRRGPLLVFLVATVVSGLALVWPVYPIAGGTRPYLLGLPLSFAWVVGGLVVMFVALVLFYRADEADSRD